MTVRTTLLHVVYVLKANRTTEEYSAINKALKIEYSRHMLPSWETISHCDR